MTDKLYPDTHPMAGASTLRSFLLKSPLLWLLILAPIAALLDYIGTVPARVLFFSVVLAIVPFAKLIVQGTEQVAAHTGATIGDW